MVPAVVTEEAESQPGVVVSVVAVAVAVTVAVAMAVVVVVRAVSGDGATGTIGDPSAPVAAGAAA